MPVAVASDGKNIYTECKYNTGKAEDNF